MRPSETIVHIGVELLYWMRKLLALVTQTRETKKSFHKINQQKKEFFPLFAKESKLSILFVRCWNEELCNLSNRDLG